jgi:hypothetical protein
MEELIKLVSQKTGLPEDKAEAAVNTVLDYITKKLPDPIAAQVKAAASNEDVVSQAADIAKNLFGGKKK